MNSPDGIKDELDVLPDSFVHYYEVSDRDTYISDDFYVPGVRDWPYPTPNLGNSSLTPRVGGLLPESFRFVVDPPSKRGNISSPYSEVTTPVEC